MNPYVKKVHEQQDKMHLLDTYTSVREAMNQITQVKDKDKYLIQIQSALYKMEDMLFQYVTASMERSGSK